MREFQQLLADLGEASFPTLPGEKDLCTILEETYKNIREAQKRGVYPTKLSGPLGTQFELTYKCNLKCIQCYNQSGCERNKWPEMSSEAWCKLAESLGRMGIVEAVISGGEPLLSPCVFDVMDILKDYGVKFIFITNAYALTKEKFDRLLKYDYSRFQISIDGSTEEIHDRIRGAKGSFRKTIDYSLAASQCGLPLTIAHCAMKDNVEDVENMIDLAYLLGAMQIISDKAMAVGRGYINYDQIQIPDAEYEKVRERILKKRKEYRGRMEVTYAMSIAAEYRYRLVAPVDVLLVRPNGDVKISCVLPFKVGNVCEKSIEKIWENAQNIYEDERVIEYISQVKTDEDALRIHPIPHVDEDIYVEVKNGS